MPACSPFDKSRFAAAVSPAAAGLTLHCFRAACRATCVAVAVALRLRLPCGCRFFSRDFTPPHLAAGIISKQLRVQRVQMTLFRI